MLQSRWRATAQLHFVMTQGCRLWDEPKAKCGSINADEQQRRYHKRPLVTDPPPTGPSQFTTTTTNPATAARDNTTAPNLVPSTNASFGHKLAPHHH